MIKVTNRFLEEVVTAPMQSWYSEHRFPFKFMYWVGRAVDKAKSEFKHFNDARMEIIKEHAELDGKGRPKTDETRNAIVWKDQENEKEAMQEINELRDQEIELPINSINVDLDDPKFGDVSFAEMSILSPLIVAEEKSNAKHPDVK